jgi:hypothetical protein
MGLLRFVSIDTVQPSRRSSMGGFFYADQDAETVRQRRSRFAQTLNVENGSLGDRKHWRDFSVRQDPFYGRTALTKCGRGLLRSSLAAALLGTRCISARRGWAGEKAGLASCTA